MLFFPTRVQFCQAAEPLSTLVSLATPDKRFLEKTGHFCNHLNFKYFSLIGLEDKSPNDSEKGRGKRAFSSGNVLSSLGASPIKLTTPPGLAVWKKPLFRAIVSAFRPDPSLSVENGENVLTKKVW